MRGEWRRWLVGGGIFGVAAVRGRVASLAGGWVDLRSGGGEGGVASLFAAYGGGWATVEEEEEETVVALGVEVSGKGGTLVWFWVNLKLVKA